MSNIKVALVLPGGVASGVNNRGIPLFLRLCKYLGELCDLTVISLTTIDNSFVPPNYSLYGLDLKHDANLIVKERQFASLFKRIHKKHQFDLIHGIWTTPSGLMAVRMSKKYGLKSVVSLQGGDLVYFPELGYGGNRGWLKRKLNNFILDRADALSAETFYQAKNLNKEKHLKKLNRIYYGIDPSEFPERRVEEMKAPLRFIHVSNLNVIKNQEFLIEVFAEINRKRPSHLRLIGPDYYGGIIQKKTRALKLDEQVSYEGYLPFEEIKLALKEADVMLHTSHYESTCMSVIEAMASKVLVCGTDVGIMSDLKGRACFVSTSKDPAKFATEALKFIANKTQREEKRAAAFQWTRQNTMEKCASSFYELYKELLGE